MEEEEKESSASPDNREGDDKENAEGTHRVYTFLGVNLTKTTEICFCVSMLNHKT